MKLPLGKGVAVWAAVAVAETVAGTGWPLVTMLQMGSPEGGATVRYVL